MWDDFVTDIEKIFEALDNFFENHCKPLLVLVMLFMSGMIVGYSMAYLEYHETEQAEAYVEAIGEEEGENVK